MQIITTYRYRDQHLKRWLKHYDGHDLVVVEQTEDGKFNKGALLNAYFLEEGHKHGYSIYNDVDYYLVKEKSPQDIFDFPENPTHLAAFSTLNGNNHEKDYGKWREAYKDFFGGVVALSSAQVSSVNGWTNKMSGWSPEDDEIKKRLIEKRWQVSRRNGYFISLDHPRDMSKVKSNMDVLKTPRAENDGMNCLKYTVISCEKFASHTRILVSLR